jgi:hypothetical protein
MYKANKQEQFQIAYVTAIAAHAGANHLPPVVDEDSVDIQIMGVNFPGKIRNPQIHLQLKCTSQNIQKGDVLKFALPIKNYNDLRGENVICPRYLVVLLVPEDENSWIAHEEKYMVLYNHCFWVSIRDLPETTNTSTVTIDIPVTQRFTTNTLQQLLVKASNE